MYDTVGAWTPADLLDLAWCEAEEHVTPAGVQPAWATQLRTVAQARAAVHGFCWHHNASCTDPACNPAGC